MLNTARISRTAPGLDEVYRIEGTGLTRIVGDVRRGVLRLANKSSDHEKSGNGEGGGPVALRTLFAPLLQPLTYGERTDCRQAEDIPRYQTMA